MAMYQFSYGMTDKKKPAFKITLTIDNRTLSMEHFEYSTLSNKFILPKYYNYANHDHSNYNNLYDTNDNDWDDEDVHTITLNPTIIPSN